MDTFRVDKRLHSLGALPKAVLRIDRMNGNNGLGERWLWCHDCEESIAPGARLNGHVQHRTESHPTQKPEKLSRYLLRAILPNDQTGDVLVPFAGSGSECRVAQSMGHNYLGIELDEQWVRLARETLAATEPML